MGSETKLSRVPEDGGVQLDADDETDDQPQGLPSLSVKVQHEDEEQVQEEVQEEVPDEPMEGVCSQQGEEHKRKQDALNRQRNLICLQHVLLWSAMAITLCLSFQPRTMSKSDSGCLI